MDQQTALEKEFARASSATFRGKLRVLPQCWAPNFHCDPAFGRPFLDVNMGDQQIAGAPSIAVGLPEQDVGHPHGQRGIHHVAWPARGKRRNTHESLVHSRCVRWRRVSFPPLPFLCFFFFVVSRFQGFTGGMVRGSFPPPPLLCFSRWFQGFTGGRL